MSIPFFLYRRLSRWITCEFGLQNKAKITLQNKHEVASFRDVFCHPFYWQLFQWVDEPPNLVIDCGAHCGHFSILADICFNSKFKKTDTKYVLIEPNPYLLKTIRKNISDAEMVHRVNLKQGLLGARSGERELWINHKSYLTAGFNAYPGSVAVKIPYLNLADIIGGQTVDLMKIDIEGGEFEFIDLNLDFMTRVKLVFMELHEASVETHQKLFKSLSSVGLELVGEPVDCNGQQLVIFQRQMTL